MTSIWTQSAPASSIARTSSPSRAKSALRIEGAMRMGAGSGAVMETGLNHQAKGGQGVVRAGAPAIPNIRSADGARLFAATLSRPLVRRTLAPAPPPTALGPGMVERQRRERRDEEKDRHYDGFLLEQHRKACDQRDMHGKHHPALPRDRQAGAIAVGLGAEPGAIVEEEVEHQSFSLGGRPRLGGWGGFTVTPRRASASRSSTSISALALRRSAAAVRSIAA